MRRIVVWLSLFLLVMGDGVRADQITDIGVTRADMVRDYRQLWLAFAFGEEDRLIDGRPRIKGECDQCPKVFLTIELIGPRRGYIQTASVVFAVSDKLDDACLLKGKLALHGLLDKIFPKWEDDVYNFADWLTEAILEDENTTMYRNGLRISLTILKLMDGRIFTLTVDSD